MSEMQEQHPRRLVGWLALAAAWVAAGVWAFAGPWHDIVHIVWTQPEMSHIYLVLPIIGWLVWMRRDKLNVEAWVPSALGPILVCVGWAVSHYGFHHAIQSFYHLGAVIGAVGCIASILGQRLLLQLWPALLVLLFLVPIPLRVRLAVALPMQDLSARATVALLGLFTADVSQSGTQIIFRHQPVTVEEQCDGMRMVFPLFLIVYAFCAGVPLKSWVRVLLIVLSPVVAILCNVLRLVPSVLIFGYAGDDATGQQWARGFHDLAGWVMLPLAFIMLMGIVKLLRKLQIDVKETRITRAPSDRAAALMPGLNRQG